MSGVAHFMLANDHLFLVHRTTLKGPLVRLAVVDRLVSGSFENAACLHQRAFWTLDRVRSSGPVSDSIGG